MNDIIKKEKSEAGTTVSAQDEFEQYQKQFKEMTVVEEGVLSRHRIRNLLFRLKDKNVNKEDKFLAQAVFEIISEQWRPGMGLGTFTFDWDVGVDKPLRVITKDEWEDAGGEYDEEMLKRNVKLRRPPAFTQQQ